MQMHRLCAGAGITYLHVLQPNQYVPGSKPMGQEELQRAVKQDHPYRQKVVEGYPRLRAAGTELKGSGVAFLHLTMAFASIDEPLYIDTCCHFDFEGNRILANHVAQALSE